MVTSPYGKRDRRSVGISATRILKMETFLILLLWMIFVPVLLLLIYGIGYSGVWLFRWIWKSIRYGTMAYRKARAYDKLIYRISEIEEKERTIADHEEKAKNRIQLREQDFEKLVSEKTKGFPWLANAFAEYLHLEDLKETRSLTRKKRPAMRAAEMMKESASRRKDAECKARVLKYQIEYYESLFPWLSEFKNEEIAEELIRIETNRSQEPDRDGSLLWLSEGEYKTLPSSTKFQLALERYWKRKKTRFEIGRDYERYIGWTYERDGYSVYYQGIIKGFDDLGRDLIATKGKEATVVQCKYWSREKTIHEKHIFQLYGTMTSYQIENPDQTVFGRFVTSTNLSDRSRKFSEHLGIKISENTPLDEYPCIKCNIAAASGEKIYHLPFDQQYDTTKIEPEKGEMYCRGIAEAENKGFRRAMRYRGPNH
jgi:hypothetical protein